MQPGETAKANVKGVIVLHLGSNRMISSCNSCKAHSATSFWLRFFTLPICLRQWRSLSLSRAWILGLCQFLRQLGDHLLVKVVHTVTERHYVKCHGVHLRWWWCMLRFMMWCFPEQRRFVVFHVSWCLQQKVTPTVAGGGIVLCSWSFEVPFAESHIRGNSWIYQRWPCPCQVQRNTNDIFQLLARWVL